MTILLDLKPYTGLPKSCLNVHIQNANECFHLKKKNKILPINHQQIVRFSQVELRSEERLNEEQKRHRELLARVEREAILQNENCQIKIRTIELEANNMREELQRLRMQYDKQSAELKSTTEKLEDTREHLQMAQEELTEAKNNEKK